MLGFGTGSSLLAAGGFCGAVPAPGQLLGCFTQSGCPTWVRAALPSCLGSCLWFLNKSQEPLSKVRCGQPGHASCHRGLKHPSASGCQGTGSIHNPMCSIQKHSSSPCTSSLSLPHLAVLVSLCVLLVMLGEEEGAEGRVLGSDSPAGSFSTPPCLPLAPECAPVSAGCFQGILETGAAPVTPCITRGILGEAVE